MLRVLGMVSFNAWMQFYDILICYLINSCFYLNVYVEIWLGMKSELVGELVG